LQTDVTLGSRLRIINKEKNVMKTASRVGIILGFSAVFSFAESWTGKVLDAGCFESQKTTEKKSSESLARTCAPTATTMDFMIQTSDGKVYKVNSSGNAELAKDIQTGVLKKDKDGDIHATVTGSLEDGIVKVDAIQLEGK